jgi:hypothetical protein
MKNLANCKPSEFLKQTSRIRKATEKWLDYTGILDIRKNLPEYEAITADMSEEEIATAQKENAKRRDEQICKNLSAMLDAIMDEHPEETLELLALLCFVEPKDVDDHEISEYLEAITDMVTNKAALGFFTSLAQLGQMNI